MKIKILILNIFLTLGICCSFVSAQENSLESQESERAVRLVEIKGNKAISTQVILSKIKTRKDQNYSSMVASEDLKRLYALGYFSDITIDLEDYQGGVKVIFNVTEKPLIQKVTILGKPRFIKQQKIIESLKSKEGQYFDEALVKEDVENIKRMYQKKGFSEAQIEYKTTYDKENNAIDIEISIKENRRVKIRSIKITGNNSIKAGKIIKVMKTKKALIIFRPGFLDDDVIEEDMERIKSFYRKQGFMDVKANYEVDFDAKKARLYVTVFIEEGRKYYVGTFNIEGNSFIKLQQIKKKITKILPGKVYAQELMQDDIRAIQALYFEKGYIFAQVKELAILNPDTGKIDVTYNITENDVAYVDKVKIRGNIRTKDIVIRRELRIRPGDRFDGEKLKRSKDRLKDLDYFEEINYDIEPPDDLSDPDKRNLIVDVKESKTGEFSLGGGYSSVDKFVGFVEVAQRNFDWRNWPYFTGDGQDLRVRAEFGQVSNELLLSFTEPWLFDYPVSFGFDIFRSVHERSTDIGFGYEEQRTGGDLRLGKRFTDYLSGLTMYRLEQVKISKITSDASSFLLSESGKNTISSMSFSLAHDTRDNTTSPTKGHLVGQSVEIAGGPFGGDKDFTKFITKGSQDFPLWRDSVLEFRLQFGFTSAFGDSDSVPIYERFFVGGSNTVRGYHERSLGPIDPISKDSLGGESMMVGNIEYTYPVIEDMIKAAVFCDIGNAWEKESDFGDSFKSSIGLGLRIKTPIGPIRLDYGFPFDKEPGRGKKTTGRFHWSMSRGF
ncbi:MAG: outer membrane protein assembly factor BamA [Candidatus Omnitrophota bacterium]